MLAARGGGPLKQGWSSDLKAGSTGYRGGTGSIRRATGPPEAGPSVAAGGHGMRVLFAVSDWSAHYAPMVPLGWALQAAGHEVRVVCTPAQAAPLGAAGLTAVPILGGPDMVFQTRLMYWFTAKAGARPYPGMPLHPVTGEEMASLEDFDFGAWMGQNKKEVATSVKANFEGTVEYAKAYGADLVVHDPLAVEGLLAAKVLGVPALQHHWGPVGSDEQDPALRLMPPDPGGFFPRYGFGELTTDQIEHVIDPCVDALALPTRADRIPVRYVPYNGPGDMPTWVLEEPERPRVCVVWGNSLTGMFGPRSFVVPQIVEALAGLDVDVMLTGTPQDTAVLGRLPSNVRLFERFPIRFLLPTCSAVVHHGGAGCAMTSLALGVPQLALTFAVEQEANGRRVAETGAGLQLRGDLADPQAVREGVTRLLEDDAFRKTARTLAEDNQARPAPAALVPVLERLAAGESN
jgi:UDP:flavonoid glycosyltransferase YjiC (YdhE family)